MGRAYLVLWVHQNLLDVHGSSAAFLLGSLYWIPVRSVLRMFRLTNLEPQDCAAGEKILWYDEWQMYQHRKQQF